MAMTIKFEPINRDIALFVRELEPEQQSQRIAEVAEAAIEEAKEINRRALGRVPVYRVLVDGNEGAPLASVRPNGVIFAEFELIIDVLRYIGQQLVQFSPVETGRYQRSHKLFADGLEVELGSNIPIAEEYVFVNSVPYARKIERGASSEAPDGVYQAVASLARRRYGNVARITFSFRAIAGGERNPAVIVRIGRA